MLHINIHKKLSHFDLKVSFSVGNEIVILFGASGSGKTTILNCIAGLIKPDAGEITLQGRTLYDTSVTVPTPKRNIGYLFQDYALFPHMTVFKNIRYGAKSDELAKQLMKELAIDHLSEQYPLYISGGEKQRVALARALATEPEALLLDEPFSALDEATRANSHEELIRLQKLWDIPIIMVTHSTEEAKKLGNRILHIEKGHFITK
ncbi:ATP-binding cassette domain-containing protein [Virgibacillus halodenitrificans]|uniref:ATP-binding cassette domain-containing protein n=1 Tax=Virgibacillus halodenitrificans TaxID=1482 RepID=A0ABR7VNX3_VIRHA|nr:ATP-binding cassette domain-containing protein [Virgibacillus halodenitrificans]MBD1222512.1 ATP-binding cassette domain-containing protein [Virgibacillus halodenitrificans]MYL44138.1 ATP-binding cassette domain-containing protein [Virgibacillus halodenitrificans]